MTVPREASVSDLSNPPFTKGFLAEAQTAVQLAELALRWKIMKDLAQSAADRLEKILHRVHEPRALNHFPIVLWALRKLPYAHTTLIVKALENVRALKDYFDRPWTLEPK